MPDFVVENLRPTAGQTVKPGGHQAFEDRANRQVFLLGDEADLFRRQRVQGQGKVGLGPAEQLLEVGKPQLGVHAALEEDLNAPHGHGFGELLGQHLARKGVGLLALRGPEEIAELARCDAKVGVVHIAVDDVRDQIPRMQELPSLIGGLAQVQKRRALVETNALGRT